MFILGTLSLVGFTAYLANAGVGWETILSAAANLSLLATVVFLAYQVSSERNDRKYDAYENLMSEFSQAALYLVDHPSLAESLYSGKNKPEHWDSYSQEEKNLYSYFDSLLGLFERVWVAQSDMHFAEPDWEAWRSWIRNLANNSVFVDAYHDNSSLYDSTLVKEMKQIIEQASKVESEKQSQPGNV